MDGWISEQEHLKYLVPVMQKWETKNFDIKIHEMYNHLSHLIPILFLVIGQERSKLQVTLLCHSPLSENLPDDEKPKCQPYWEDNDPSMPLPFNLEDIIFELQTMLED
ncbi:hypothetical protein E2320_001243 [Naja naja]|nr:hypothetical protein E2320_001243 [Naja naja]